MAQSRQDILARINSVDSTKKITKAMQLVASSKLTKQRESMEKNRVYASSLDEMLNLVLRSADSRNPYCKVNEGKPSFIFVIASDMGLCGGYNMNIFKELKEINKSQEDRIVMIGSRGCGWAHSHDVKLEAEIVDLNEDIAYSELSKQMEIALDLFEKKEISKIQVLYTHYKNTLTFVPTLQTILPVEKKKEEVKKVQAVTIFEPNQETMLAYLIPMACKSILYSLFLESKTSEQASRRMAMESATDNADELQDQLELAYNRIRQSAITQEISEIVGGANALAS